MRRGILFDVDGTLVDSNYLHCLAWVRAFRRHGYDVPAAAVHRCIGMGADRLVRTLVGQPDDAVAQAHSERYAELYRDLRALPRAGDLLRAVKGRGVTVALATSAREEEVGALLWALDADDAIDTVTSSADVPEAKPEPDVFLAAMESAHLSPDACVVVGDTVWDVEAARRAGLGCVGLLTGGISGQELLAAGALAVYDSPGDLLDHLDDSPLGALLGETRLSPR